MLPVDKPVTSKVPPVLSEKVIVPAEYVPPVTYVYPVTSKVPPELLKKLVVPEEYVPPITYVLGVSTVYTVPPPVIVPPVRIISPFTTTN